MSSLTVNLGENSYDILIEAATLGSVGQMCARLGLRGQVAVISNPTVFALYGKVVEESLVQAGNTVTVITIPDGEEYKNSATLNSVYDGLINAGLDRKSYIVALGGGVVGDLAGFAAATYLRGIPFVQVPTTLLAQVDSSVGGKTAIDHPLGKNLIGAFYQPKFVLIDVETLNTLPEREFRAGLAEVIKYGVAIDSSLFQLLEDNVNAIAGMDRTLLERIIFRCCQLKAQVVELDEKESGLRAVLNYGHTLGHAFETVAGYQQLVHGEAVAIGMALAVRVCEALGLCSAQDGQRVTRLISDYKLPVNPPKVAREQLLEILGKDKKVRSGSVTFICNKGIGNYVEKKLSPEQLITLSGLEV